MCLLGYVSSCHPDVGELQIAAAGRLQSTVRLEESFAGDVRYGTHRTWRARCSERVNTLLQSPNPRQRNILPPLMPTGTMGAPSGV